MVSKGLLNIKKKNQNWIFKCLLCIHIKKWWLMPLLKSLNFLSRKFLNMINRFKNISLSSLERFTRYSCKIKILEQCYHRRFHLHRRCYCHYHCHCRHHYNRGVVYLLFKKIRTLCSNVSLNINRYMSVNIFVLDQR